MKCKFSIGEKQIHRIFCDLVLSLLQIIYTHMYFSLFQTWSVLSFAFNNRYRRIIKLKISPMMFTCRVICIGNSMILFCSDIWHKYHSWYFKIVVRNFTSRWGHSVKFETILKYHEWYLRQISCTNHAFMFSFSTFRKRFVIFTCKYFKLSRNTTTQSQSNLQKFLTR